MPGADERKTKSSTPRATPCHCSPSAARLTSFSSVTGRLEASLELGAERRRPRGRATLVASAIRAGVGVDDARDADDDAVEQLAVEAGRASTSESRSSAIASSDALGVGAVDLDVLARAHVAAQVADRAAQEPGAEVEAEHERRLRDRLEEDGAVARAVRLARRLADEPGLEQRLQRERHGRLRDAGPARDLGARDRRPDRIASSTVRSFRSLSSGGIAAAGQVEVAISWSGILTQHGAVQRLT